MTRCKLVALKFLSTLSYVCIDFRGIDETNRPHLRSETRHTLSSMSHKPNRPSWDQDVAASPREFHETDNNRTNSASLLATWQYFSFRHIWFSKLFIPPKIIANYSFLFFKCFVIRARQKKFPDLREIIIFCKNDEQENCPPFWKT